jgi:hypothetical protein
LKIKLKDRHFYTTEVIEVESQAVLNALSEQNFQDAFQNGRSNGNSAYAPKGSTSKVMVASRSKVSFHQMAAPVQDIMDGFLYIVTASVV